MTFEGHPKEKIRHSISGRRIKYDAGLCFGDAPHSISADWLSYDDEAGTTMFLNRCSRCEKLLERIEISVKKQ